MRFTDRFYKSLVFVNTALLSIITVCGVFLAIHYRERIQARFRAVIDREVVSSRFLDSIHLGAEAHPEFDYPVYGLSIHPADLRHIQTQVQQLMEVEVMTDNLKLWHPATFYHEGEEHRVKIRLRGDLRGHWAGDKKSWRVRFKKDKLFRGRREIDFIIPGDKHYEVELVAYDAARDLGLLVPDAGFCRLRINGVDFGTYTWIERYGGEMLEKQGYPVGDIFRQQNVWVQTRLNGFGALPWNQDIGYRASMYDNVIREDPSVGFYARRWYKFANLVRNGDDKTFRREIPHLLNIEKFLAWNALTWLFGSVHSHGGDNLRWYYDNTSGLFEPILYDVQRHSIRLLESGPHAKVYWLFEESEPDMLVQRVIQVPQYRQRRNEILWQLLNDDRFDMAQRSERYYKHLRPLLLAGVGAKDPSFLDRFHQSTIKILEANRKHLREHLSFARVFITPLLSSRNGKPTLQLELLPDSRNFIAVEKLNLEFGLPVAAHLAKSRTHVILTDGSGSQQSIDEMTVSNPTPRSLAIDFRNLTIWTPVDQRLRQLPAKWTLHIEFDGISLSEWQMPGLLDNFKASFRNSLTREPIDRTYIIAAPLIYQFEETNTESPILPVHDFIALSGLPFALQSGVLVLPKGEYIVKQNLTIPAGYGLRLEAGTVLRMGPGVSMVVYGPLTVLGTGEEPVRIIPHEEGTAWGSFAIVRSPEVSRVHHLEVSGGSEAYMNGLFLSCQLCFYWSDVRLEHCIISDARADDGINVKKAKLSVHQCVFRDNAVDGFDADWVTGAVGSSAFIRNGGDGLDFSGSRVAIHHSLFEGMGDKGISVGENSDILAYNNVFKHSKIGLACKDLSHAGIYASVFYGNETAVAVYRKKQLFGGATGEAVGSLFWNNVENVTADMESHFELKASAVDHWKDTKRVTRVAPLSGDLDQYFIMDTDGNILHDRSTFETSPFRIRIATQSITFNGLTIPDLGGSSVGLQQPLSLRP